MQRLILIAAGRWKSTTRSNADAANNRKRKRGSAITRSPTTPGRLGWTRLLRRDDHRTCRNMHCTQSSSCFACGATTSDTAQGVRA